jgi:hypothetical protein
MAPLGRIKLESRGKLDFTRYYCCLPTNRPSSKILVNFRLSEPTRSGSRPKKGGRWPPFLQLVLQFGGGRLAGERLNQKASCVRPWGEMRLAGCVT